MNSQKDILTIIEQKIDFIGQLFVEFEQLQKYPDILTSAEKRRCLATLFFDFIDRLNHLNKFITGKNKKELTIPELSPPCTTSKNHLHTLTEFYLFYKSYPHIYPEKINPEIIKELFAQFSGTVEAVVQHLREFTEEYQSADAK